MWSYFKIECLEIFLSRAFMVNDQYTRILTGEAYDDNSIDATTDDVVCDGDNVGCDEMEDWEEIDDWEYETDHAFDILFGYQDIVLRAVYFELNAIVELEIKNLAQSILNAKGIPPKKLNRGESRNLIEKEYQIKFEQLPRFTEIDEILKIANAYKHDDGFTGDYEELVPNAGWLLGYKETTYKLEEEKARQSIQAVKDFMRALPGDRQGFHKIRPKPEDNATLQTRRMAADYLKKSGALGHDLDEPIKADEGYTAKCKLCGKSFWHENVNAFAVIGVLDKCPGNLESHTDNKDRIL